MAVLIVIFVCLCSFGSVASAVPVECFHVNTSTQRIQDGHGRERLFHGVNVVVKGPPWVPRTDIFDPRWSFNEKDMELLQSLGLNAIRLGMMWPGAEPKKDAFNQTYFNVIKDIVSRAAKYNIHSLLDMHQDCLSGKFCGEGAPDWAIETGGAPDFPKPLSSEAFTNDPKTGYPSKEECSRLGWSTYQLTAAAASAYQHIYNNTNGLLDQFAEFWGKVASEFHNSSAILGYEIINEPFAGDFYRHPTLLWPEVADKENLAHVYDVVSGAIWKNDGCHNVFFESVTWDEWRVGFDTPPGGSSNGYRSVLSYHFYRPPQLEPDITWYNRMEDFRRLGCGGFLTEFSILSGLEQEVMSYCDKYLQSWTGWDYKPYADITGDGSSLWFNNGTVNVEVAKTLSRTYAQAVAGRVSSMEFDPSSSKFTLIYHYTESCTSNVTEIYLNQDLHYSSGFIVQVLPSTVLYSSPAKNFIVVTHPLKMKEGTEIMVEITKR